MTTLSLLLPACSGGGGSTPLTSSALAQPTLQSAGATQISSSTPAATGATPQPTQPGARGALPSPTPIPTASPTIATPSPIPVASKSAAPPTPYPSLPPGIVLASEIPRAANAFAESFGFNTAFSKYTSPYGTNYGAASSMLLASGVHHLRDGQQLILPQYAAELRSLCAQGIHHTISFNIDVTPQQIVDTIDAYGPSCVDAVEPKNEYDSYPDANWASVITNETRTIYNTIRANPAFGNITVMGPALAAIWRYKYLGNLEGISDVGNMHDATCDGNPGTTYYRGLNSRIDFMRVSWPTKPIWTTETDYGDDLSPGASHCNLADSVIAKYVGRTQAERFNRGQSRNYWFGFMEDPANLVYGQENFISAAGQAKPQYTATQSLIAVLKDPGASVALSPFSYALSGNTANVHHSLLRRQNGTYQLMLWIEVPSWSTTQHVVLSVPQQTITVYVPASVSSATYNAYRADLSMPAANVPITRRGVTVNVADMISVLSFK